MSLISVVIPTYNEKENIEPLAERISHALDGRNYEIILVDDNSPDGTAELASRISQQYHLRLITREGKRGLASAIVDGIAEARGDIIAVMDADLQHPPESLNQMVKEIDNGAELVVASRYTSGGSVEGWGLSRKTISRGATFLAHLFLPQTRGVKDPMSGFFIFRRETINGKELRPVGYKILLEILVLGDYREAVEVPYTFQLRSRGKSKLGLRQETDYLRHIFELMKRSGELRRFIKFCLVGLSGVGVNLGLTWLLTESAGLYYVVSNAIGIETSIISNFLLNNYFTFADRNKPGARALLGRLLKFNAASLVGLGINLGATWLFTDRLGLYYLLSNVIGIALSMLWNYLSNNWWTWSWRKQ